MAPFSKAPRDLRSSLSARHRVRFEPGARRRLRAVGLAALPALLLATACEPPPDRSGNAGKSDKTAAKSDAVDPAQAEALRGTGLAPADGWGDTIKWKNFDHALTEAKATNRPIMVVVHTSWCSKCRALKKSFQSAELTSLSEEFVMVHVDQDVEPTALAYAPDGEYIPRVMFLSPDGELDTSLRNDRSPRYAYFYTPYDDMVAKMKQALEKHGSAS